MKAVVQRVKQAKVVIADETVSEISLGFLVFLGVAAGDTDEDLIWLANKVAGLRIFENDEGKMSLSTSDVQGEFLIVSQFTLLGSLKKGFRPSFISAEAPEPAQKTYDAFCKHVEKISERPVKRGVFAADMQVSLTNDGPVTILLDSRSRD